MYQFSRQVKQEVQLVDAATVSIDASKGDWFYLSTSSSRTLGAPSNPAAGQMIVIAWKAGANLTITLDTGTGGFRFPGTANSLSQTNSGVTDCLVARYHATDNKWDVLGYSGNDLAAIANEVIAARGSRSALGDRIGVISNFASPNGGGVVTGNYYDNSFHGAASGTLAGVANRIELAPYYTSVNLSIDQIGIACSTAVASALCKVVIYGSNAAGWPDGLLYESGNLDVGTTGYKSAALTFTFLSGTQYWVGVRHSSTATLRTIPVSSAVNLGVNGSNGSNYFTVLRRTLTFATAATDPWAFTSTDLVANIAPPSIRFRAA